MGDLEWRGSDGLRVFEGGDGGVRARDSRWVLLSDWAYTRTTEHQGRSGCGGPEVTYSGFSFGSELLLGGTPADGLVIGGSFLYSQVSDPTVDSSVGEFTADGTMFIASTNLFAQYYFNPNEGPHVQVMIGYGGIDFVDEDGGSGGNDPVGLNLAIGGGYDFWIGSEWSVGPFLRVQYASMSPSDVEVSYSYLFPSLGASFTYH